MTSDDKVQSMPSASKDTRSDSLISLELQTPASNALDDPEAVDRRQQIASYQIPTWKAIFLIFRSLVGIGVLTMPHAVQSFGVNGALILLPLFTVGILYVLDLVLRIANDLGFNGSNIDELIVKSGNEKWRNTFSIINNWMMIAGGVANCIFAGRFAADPVMFLNWASCSLGWGICGNKLMIHLVAFLISIPLAFIPRMNFFVICTFFATIIIAFTGRSKYSSSKLHPWVSSGSAHEHRYQFFSELVQTFTFGRIFRCCLLLDRGYRLDFPN